MTYKEYIDKQTMISQLTRTDRGDDYASCVLDQFAKLDL
jgi:hypothetical protein